MSTDVLRFPKPSYFGGCPTCRRYADLNIGREHWGVCHIHRIKWFIGDNLFSGWRDEEPSTWAANAVRLSTYRTVEPYNWPTSTFTAPGDPP